jgi:hypothetical protein
MGSPDNWLSGREAQEVLKKLFEAEGAEDAQKRNLAK